MIYNIWYEFHYLKHVQHVHLGIVNHYRHTNAIQFHSTGKSKWKVCPGQTLQNLDYVAAAA